MEQWGQAHLMLYSIIPFILLGLSNLFLLQKSYKSFRYKKRKSLHESLHRNNTTRKSIKVRSASFGKTIIFLTLLFFIMTLPTAVVSFFFNRLITTNEGKFFITLSNCISFSYHGLNYFIYNMSNKKFRSESKNTFF
jgi:hypothetical protein